MRRPDRYRALRIVADESGAGGHDPPDRYRFLGREVKNIRGTGKFRTLKFRCELATSTGESFEDGSEFTIWISDDRNRIPLYVESPIRVGSIRARLISWKNLKYPLDSKIK